MKILITLALTSITGLGLPAFASGLGACTADKSTQRAINKVDPANRVEILNAVGDVVGAVVFEEKVPSDKMSELYLCGQNINYYYIDANLSEWIADPGVNLPIKGISNDEYLVTASAHTLINKKDYIRLKLQLAVKLIGRPRDADFEPFSALVFVNFPGIEK